jgi:hypothetical protein
VIAGGLDRVNFLAFQARLDTDGAAPLAELSMWGVRGHSRARRRDLPQVGEHVQEQWL